MTTASMSGESSIFRQSVNARGESRFASVRPVSRAFGSMSQIAVTRCPAVPAPAEPDSCPELRCR